MESSGSSSSSSNNSKKENGHGNASHRTSTVNADASPKASSSAAANTANNSKKRKTVDFSTAVAAPNLFKKDAWKKTLEDLPRCFAVEGLHQTSCFFRDKNKNAAAASSSSSSSTQSCLRRLLHELSSLEQDLPEHPAIWLAFDEERPQYLRACITAPASTPYSHGLFVFDIHVPDAYPHVPPTVRLLNTGNGTTSFSPNLYADGKVCLSLLGTWSGPRWNPQYSTLLQVLVSIQGLILGAEHPYYLEPGYGGWEGQVPLSSSSTTKPSLSSSSPGLPAAGSALTATMKALAASSSSSTTTSATATSSTPTMTTIETSTSAAQSTTTDDDKMKSTAAAAVAAAASAGPPTTSAATVVGGSGGFPATSPSAMHPFFTTTTSGNNSGNAPNDRKHAAAKRYEERTRVATLKYALLEPLSVVTNEMYAKTSSVRFWLPFMDVLRAHFLHHKTVIKYESERWLWEAKTTASNAGSAYYLGGGGRSMLKPLVFQLEESLDKLVAAPTLSSSSDGDGNDDTKPSATSNNDGGSNDNAASAKQAVLANKRQKMEEAVQQGDYLKAGWLQTEISQRVGNCLELKMAAKRERMEQLANQGDYVMAGKLQATLKYLEQNKHRLLNLERRFFEAAQKLDFCQAGRFQEQHRILSAQDDDDKSEGANSGTGGTSAYAPKFPAWPKPASSAFPGSNPYIHAAMEDMMYDDEEQGYYYGDEADYGGAAAAYMMGPMMGGYGGSY